MDRTPTTIYRTLFSISYGRRIIICRRRRFHDRALIRVFFQLLDTLPVCRDFKQGHCERQNCRYVHLLEGESVFFLVKVEDLSASRCDYLSHTRRRQSYRRHRFIDVSFVVNHHGSLWAFLPVQVFVKSMTNRERVGYGRSNAESDDE